MSELAELTHGVLQRVAEFLRKLPADQLAELAQGSAQLQVVPKGTRRPGRRAAAAKPPPVTAEQVRAELSRLRDGGAARRWLEDLKLTVPQLKELAKELGISLPSKATKPVVLDQIVQWTVGRRLDSDAISRPTPARF